MAMMKAITLKHFGGPEVMQLSSVEVPVPAPGQVLIKVAATSVNKPDIVQRQGNYPPPPGDSEVLGLEVAGVVESVGDDVSSPVVGTRVTALVGGGGYAEHVVAWAGHCITLPDSVSFEEGACLCETYITAYLNVLELGELRNGESVLLHGGGGGVNTAAIQLCKALRPDCPLFVTASAGKVDRVVELGATHVINYQAKKFDEEIKSLTGNKGVDVILDHLGALYLQQNMKSLALYGRLMLIGVSGGIKAELNLANMMIKRQRIIGSVLRSRPVSEKSDIIARFSDQIVPLLSAGRVRPLVSSVLPLADAARAHEIMEQSGHFGKIVLSVDSSM